MKQPTSLPIVLSAVVPLTTLLAVFAVFLPRPAAAQAPGLKAAYAFNEGSGSAVVDLSGFGNGGTINGATWTSQGRFGSALQFNGTSALVTVPDAPSLRLTTAMTLEGWVYPTAVPNRWTDIIMKGIDNYYLMASSMPSSLPATGSSLTSGLFGTSLLPLNTWTHLAGTYDGAQLRLYVNGVPVNSRAHTGSFAVSTGPLTFGGDTQFSQYFPGRIDEIRVYDRALSAAEIQTDMTTPIGPTGPDTTPPTVSIVSPTSGNLGGVVQVVISATDNSAVASVTLFRDGVTIGTDSSPPYAINWNTTTTGNGTHTLTAQAVDLSGNPGSSAPIAVTAQNPAFSNEVVVPGITFATTLVFLPDGRMLVGELTETISVIHPGSSTPEPTPFLQLDGSALNGEQGLMDIVLDPDFATNQWYYVFYTRASVPLGNFNRVSRFTASGDGTVPGSEVVLWQDDRPAENEHHGGAIFFGPGGKLFITTGEHFIAQDAASLDNYRGKLLRINPDGSVPTDNPFFDDTGPNRDAIWAYGLRNPFRASYDPVSGRIFIGDVGGNDPATAMEEINLGVAGANYGWPFCEGACGTTGVTDPIHAYPHLGRDASITGGFAYRGGNFPTEYEGSYFFADYTQHWIKRLTFDASGNVIGAVEFEPPDGAPDGPYGDPVKLVQGPDGSLYYVDIGFNDQHEPNEASIRRIRHLTNNLPPVAAASANPTSGAAPLDVDFSSAGSFDPEGLPLAFDWTFGDGASSNAANPSHTYTANGMYTARLQVSDGATSTLSSALPITVGTPPTLSIVTPVDGALFQAGDVIHYTGTAFDSAGTALPATAYSWSILFHHDTHVHPAGGPFPNITEGFFTIPTTGHDFTGATSYEFVLIVTGTNGLTSSSSATVFPDKVDLAFSTQPAGLSLDVDGIRKVTPFVLDTVKGFHHTINAPAQTFGGQSYDFGSWSDGGPRSHVIIVPENNASWLASFAPVGSVGLVAAYAFNEGIGSTSSDRSGFNNTATLAGATWVTQGRFGSAVSFNGTSSMVTVPDSPSLRLTSAMTLEAWVFPTAVPTRWTDVIMKGSDNYFLEATSPQGVLPAAGSSLTGPLFGPSTLQVNNWAHLAATYDGAQLRLYVNGVQVNSRAHTGNLPTSSGPLSFGGDPVFGQFFPGRIDEIRIYDRALSAAEIQSDMTIPILTAVDVSPTSPPPSSALVKAVPNPFTPSTRIRFRLASSERARLRVFDVAGRLVREFDLRQFSPGEHEVVWEGMDKSGARVSAGVYFARLDASGGTHMMRITLVK